MIHHTHSVANHIYKQHSTHSITIATAPLDWQLLLIYSYHLMPITKAASSLISTMATQWSPCNAHSIPTSTLPSPTLHLSFTQYSIFSLHPPPSPHSIPPLTNTPSLQLSLLSPTLHPSPHQHSIPPLTNTPSLPSPTRNTLLTLIYGLASKARSSASSSVLQGANAFNYGGDKRERERWSNKSIYQYSIATHNPLFRQHIRGLLTSRFYSGVA